MNDRLRMDLELKSEIIKTLRAERERDSERARDQAALMAALSAEWHQRAAALVLLLSDPDPAPARIAADHLAAASAELADYTAARAGELALTLEPVNLRQLLSHFESRGAVELLVAANVPERVLADQLRLSRILSYFVSAGLEAAGTEVLLIEVTASVADTATDSGAALPQVKFALRRQNREPLGSQVPNPNQPSPMQRLRAALAQSLCELMGATLTRDNLCMPLQSAADQAHTGVFRLALSEASATAAYAALSDPPSRPESADGAIDFMYLDRQLGSLAPVILTRTAPAFIDQAQRRMTDLHVAHDIGDLNRLRAIAHTWRGSALSVGARALATLLDAIEKQSAAGHLPGPDALWQLRGAVDQAVHALERYGEHGGGQRERA